jgi:hypothetical protein
VVNAFDKTGPVSSGAAQYLIGKGSGKALEGYANMLKDGAGDALGKVLTGLDLLDRGIRTTLFSKHTAVEVYAAKSARTWDEPVRMVHKPTNGKLRDMVVVGIVGLSKEARKSLERQLAKAKDTAFQDSLMKCAALHGINLPKNPFLDLAKEMKDWSPFWRGHIDEAHAWYKGSPRTKFTVIDNASVRTHHRLQIRPEKEKWHGHKDAIQVVRDITPELEVAAQKPPSFGAIADLALAVGTGGGLGDYVGPLAEFMEGFYRTLAKPSDVGILQVTEHIQDPCAEFWENRGGTKATASC